MTRCRQLESTAASGIISRGTETRLIRLELSIREVVPVIQARVKKLYGTRPHITKRAKLGIGLIKILVKTKVSTPIRTSGFSKDQNTPRDIFRYRILKSLKIRLDRRNRKSPCHMDRAGNVEGRV